ncbi:MAG TPA: 50S ribosomal protein L25 [Firmicutes bacterium]|nr:50S ribosomal protein L25 [Bacillota bacterium]
MEAGSNMEHIALQAEPRPVMNKGHLKQLRQDGMVPAVLYGRGKANQILQVDSRRLNQILASEGSNVLLNLQLKSADAGDGAETVMFKEIQRDPIFRDQILHVDFIRISMTDKIEVEVPLIFTGEPVGVKDEDGVLEILMREITIKCLPAEIPENFSVDVSDLKIGDSISASSLELGDRLELVTDPDEPLVQVSIVLEEEEEEEEEELEEELEEGTEELPEEGVAEQEEEEPTS